MNNSNDHLIIFDTTLRDGEQSPGASMTLAEKVRIAHMLDRMGVDVIEAGFPAASNGDFASVEAVAKSVEKSVVCALARTKKRDIDRAGEALQHAQRSRIHTFLATSPIHMEHKLHKTPDEVVAQVVAAVQQARQYTDDVEFSAEDASRSDPAFLCRVFGAAIEAGATTINIPDTVGYAIPDTFRDAVLYIMRNTIHADKATFSVHCHNDLGLAVANTLAAVGAGVRQVECTINGIGERAGNASLEEVVMAIRTRADVLPYDVGIDTTQLVPCSKLVTQITGFSVQPNKAIVGVNAFAHEAGIHQDGVIKNAQTYEIMKPESVGWTKNRLVLGKHSGRAAVRDRMKKLGITFETDTEFQSVFARFKELADHKHEIFDDDLVTLIAQEHDCVAETFALTDLAIQGSALRHSSAVTVTMSVHGEQKTCTEHSSNGIVSAIFQAIISLTGTKSTLPLYTVHNITSGIDAQAEVGVRLVQENCVVNGQGIDVDIVVASAKAYIDALNKMQRVCQRIHPHM